MISISRGKGDGHRLGHASEEHQRQPKVVESLRGKKVIDIEAGNRHVLALTESGEVYGWGSNDKGQLGEAGVDTKSEPVMVSALEGKNICGIACGVSQVSNNTKDESFRFFFFLMANSVCLSLVVYEGYQSH